MRCQPDSNWCKRFCRPVPNHSDMAPFAFASAKLNKLSDISKYLLKNSVKKFKFYFCRIQPFRFRGQTHLYKERMFPVKASPLYMSPFITPIICARPFTRSSTSSALVIEVWPHSGCVRLALVEHHIGKTTGISREVHISIHRIHHLSIIIEQRHCDSIKIR